MTPVTVSRGAAVLALVSLLAVACASCAARDTRPILVNAQMTVVIVNVAAAPPDTPTIDPADPRIGKAGQAISDLLGHPVRYEVDAALARRFGSGLHGRFVAAMEATVDGLTTGQKRAPEAYALAAPALKTIAIDYGPAAREPPPTLDRKTGVLHVVLTPSDDNLLTAYAILDMLDDVLDAATTERFAGRAPESIPPGEQATFVRYVVHHRAPTTGRRDQSAEAGARMATLLRLYNHVTDPPLRAEVRGHVLDDARSLERAVYGDNPGASTAAEPVRTSFVAWANARAGEWSLHDQDAVAELFFSDDAARDDRFRRGFDVMRFARPLVATFAAAVAHTPQTPNGAFVFDNGHDGHRAVDDVICPYRDSRGSLSTWQRCWGLLYTQVLAGPGGARSLAAWIIEVESDPFTQSAILNVLDAKGPAAAFEVVDALIAAESTPRATLVALHALAAFSDWDRRDDSSHAPRELEVLVARVVALYRARPAQRGPLLYLLTQVGRADQAHVPWGHLPQLLGSSLTAEEYGSFLDQGRKAMSDVDLLTRGLGPGWSRAAVIIPRFKRILDDHEGNDQTDRSYLAERIVRSFCDGGTLADVKAFQAFARARIDAYPSEQRVFGNSVEAPLAEACPADSAAAGAARAAPKPLLFGN